MFLSNAGPRFVVIAGLFLGLTMPSGATTLIRAGLEQMTGDHETILIGEVVDSHSYWNAEGTFILTDVRILPDEVLKGQRDAGERTVTLMGGTVGARTTLILAGSELVPGRSYLVFLGRGDLPGAANVVTVREHSQGVFDLVDDGNGLRAISQANDHPLMPDAEGRSQAVGGPDGMILESLVEQVRQLVDGRSGQREVK